MWGQSMPELHYQDESEWLEIKKDYLSSTESPALFGLCSWVTPYSLWHSKKHRITMTSPENDRMEWGKRLEPVIAQACCDKLGWDHRPANTFITHSDTVTRLGCSLDFYAESPTRGAGILECKNRDWIVWKNDWPPGKVAPEVYIQVQHQMLCTGFDWTMAACLVGGNKLETYMIERDKELGEQIEARSIEFWRRVEDDEPFPVTGLPADQAIIKKLWSEATGEIIESTDIDLLETARELDYFRAKRIASSKSEDLAKNRILDAMKDASELQLPGARIYRTVAKNGAVRLRVKIFPDHVHSNPEDALKEIADVV